MAWGRYLVAAERERKIAAAEDPSCFPRFTSGSRWTTRRLDQLSRWLADGSYDHGNWTGGFWFGVMCLRWLGSGDAAARNLAKSRLRELAPRAFDTTTHDLGFLFYPAFILGRQLGCLAPGDEQPAREAALTLGQT